MNERTKELAEQVCDAMHDGDWRIPEEFIERFAELVRQDERNKCAQEYLQDCID